MFRAGSIEVRLGKRRITVSWGGVYGECHVDGSSFFASPIGWRRSQVGHFSGDPVGVLVLAEDLALTAMAQTRMAALHAVDNSRTGGDILIRCRLLGGVTYGDGLVERQKYLIFDRRHGAVQQVRNTVPVDEADVEVTLNIEDIHA